MRLEERFGVLLLALFLCIGFSYAADEVCCYNPYSLDTVTSSFEGCGDGSIELPGQFSLYPRCDFDNPTVSHYKRLCCVRNGERYGVVAGRYVYDFSEVFSYFESEVGIDLNSYCTLEAFSESTCSENDAPIGVIIDQNDGSGGVGVGTSSGGAVDTSGYQASVDLHEREEDRRFCADTGGPFGFFLSKSQCNSLTNDDGETYPCFYNPSLTGFIKVSSSNNPYGMLPTEAGCMPKLEIDSCFDYKTEENCVENIIYDDSNYTSANLKNCRWVPFSDYYTDFNVDGGMCIGNAVDYFKHFNLESYSSRQNLLNNPSFEDGAIGWSGSFDVSYEGYSAYDGFYGVSLSAGEEISQIVNYLNKGVAYKTVVALKQDSHYRDTDRITLTITEYDDVISSSVIGSPITYEIYLGEYNASDGAYKRLTFQSHVTANDIESLDFSISSNVDIEFDAISFDVYDQNSVLADQGVFKPLEIISSDSSECGLCFDERNLNFCTQDKSDLMGDCSYMVDDLSSLYETNLPDYLGNFENEFLDNWSSQSIANSLLFCEMYLSEGQCVDPNNFVNSVYGSLHYFPTESYPPRTLCQWSPTYGCFKDSDVTGGPDTALNNGVFSDDNRVYLHVLNPTDMSVNGWDSSAFGSMYESQTENGVLSDYDYACDIVPPQVYIYFSGQTQDGDRYIVTENFPTQMLGNVNIHIEAYDVGVDACQDRDIAKRIFVDYVVDGLPAYRVAPSAFVEEVENVKDYFVNSTGDLMLEDGVNVVSIQVKDQSGNIAKPREFVMNVDLVGPEIALVNPLEPLDTLGANQTLEIDVLDYSDIVSCDFELEPLSSVVSNEGIDSSFYEAYGSLSNFSSSVTDIISGSQHGQKYMFNLPIYKTTVNENVYKLYLSCEDIFGQVTEKMVPIYVDYDTNFVLLEPRSFYSYDLDTGFINSEVELKAVSTDRNLVSCEFDFDTTSVDGLGSAFEIVEPYGATGFSVDGYSETFYKNLSATLDFGSDGLKNFSVVCSDSLGNEFREDIVYYYDTVAPELLSFEVFDGTLSKKTVVWSDGNFYVRSLNGLSLSNLINASIDGTGSWMSSDYLEMYYYNVESSLYDGALSNVRFDDYVLSSDSFVGDVEVSGFSNLIVYAGEEIFEDFYLQRYELEFMDKAGNLNTGDIQFYFDATRARFVFAEPIFEVDNVLYTSEFDPQFIVTFNSPDYNLFECELGLNSQGQEFSRTYSATSELEFKVSEFVPGFDSSRENVDIELSCVDLYNETISGSYILKYDNTVPVLSEVYFESGNHKYLPNKGQYLQYFSTTNGVYVDKLVFNMEDTGEDGYACSYQFVSDDYVCLGSVFNESFSSLTYSTSPISVLSDDVLNSICYKPEGFGDLLDTYMNNNDVLETQIDVYVQCLDNARFETNLSVVSLQIDYIAGNAFVDFDVSYEEGKAILRARSMSPFDSVGVYYDEGGESLFTSLSAESMLEDGLYVYSGEGSLSGLDSGVAATIWAIGFGEDTVWDKIRGELVVDKVAPLIDLRVPDSDENGFVYAEEFEVVFDSEDRGGSNMGLVEVYVNGNKVYDSLNLSIFGNGTILPPSSSTNYYAVEEQRHYGSVGLTNAVIGGEYEVRVVAYDMAGNMNETSRVVVVKNGVGIRLLDSTDSFVDFGMFDWITKAGAPMVSFRTSRSVDECRLYAFRDEVWADIVPRDNLELEYESIDGAVVVDNVFSFDLSSFAGFDLDVLRDMQSDLMVACEYNNTFYNYTRGIYVLNSLPDYVLTSSEGFILSEQPYKTTVVIDSVGFYKYIRCSYTIDGEEGSSFGDRVSNRFAEEIDLRLLASGSHTLELVCENKLGTLGPVKSYEFVVNKDVETLIEDVVLSNGDMSYDLDEGSSIYVRDDSGFKLSFKLNKKDILCNVEVDSRHGIVGNIVEFVASLFTDNRLELSESSKPYYYEVSGLAFANDGLNNLIIGCSGMEDKEYEVNYLGGQDFDFNISIS